jgi:phospholipid:diacylglycerol acyltransferase
MWVKGGNAVWGDATFAPDDDEGDHHTHGELISFRQTISLSLDDKDAETSPMTLAQSSNNDKPLAWKNMTVDEAGAWILGHTPLTFRVTLSPFPHLL